MRRSSALPLLALVLGLSALLGTSPAEADGRWRQAFARRSPTAGARSPGLLRRSIAPVTNLLRRRIAKSPTLGLIRQGREGLPMGSVVRRGVSRQVQEMFFVGAMKRAETRSRFRAFLREVTRDEGRRSRVRAEQRVEPDPVELRPLETSAPASEPIAQEAPSAAQLYADNLQAEGTYRRRLKVLFGAIVAFVGANQARAPDDSAFGMLLALGGAAIFVADNWWLRQKIDEAMRSTLKQLRDRGIAIPMELVKEFNIKPKAEKQAAPSSAGATETAPSVPSTP